MIGILGKKLGMTQIFTDNGNLVPVTVVEAGPCCVIQIKTIKKDGYEAAKVGFLEARKEKNILKPMLGIFKKAKTPVFKVLKEFPMSRLKVGDMITAEIFGKGDVVTVSGISKGKGFQGVMKRHNFRGGPGSHGSTFHRAPGSIGASSYPSRVWKGKKMAGRMGNERISVKNLTIVDIRPELNIVLIKGAIPGSVNSIVEIKKGK